MKFFEVCYFGGLEPDCQVVYAKSLLRAKRLAWTKTDFRHNYDFSVYRQLVLREFSQGIQERFLGVTERTEQHIIDINHPKYAYILRDVGWSCEGEDACDECERYPNDLPEFALNEYRIPGDECTVDLCQECAEKLGAVDA